MSARTKRVVSIIVTVFILYAIVQSPTVAADYVRQILVFLANAVHSIFRFFDSVLRQR